MKTRLFLIILSLFVLTFTGIAIASEGSECSELKNKKIETAFKKLHEAGAKLHEIRVSGNDNASVNEAIDNFTSALNEFMKLEVKEKGLFFKNHSKFPFAGHKGFAKKMPPPMHMPGMFPPPFPPMHHGNFGFPPEGQFGGKFFNCPPPPFAGHEGFTNKMPPPMHMPGMFPPPPFPPMHHGNFGFPPQGQFEKSFNGGSSACMMNMKDSDAGSGRFKNSPLVCSECGCAVNEKKAVEENKEKEPEVWRKKFIKK